MKKTAIVVLSDPNAGDEALGRLFNALAAAWDLARRGLPVEVVFQGAGTRWPAIVSKPDHPVHGLYEAVADRIAGASCGCADVFGARAGVEEAGLALLTANPVPGTSGLPSLGAWLAEGATVLTF